MLLLDVVFLLQVESSSVLLRLRRRTVCGHTVHFDHVVAGFIPCFSGPRGQHHECKAKPTSQLPIPRRFKICGLHVAHGENDATSPHEPSQQVRNGSFLTFSHETPCVVKKVGKTSQPSRQIYTNYILITIRRYTAFCAGGTAFD
jgi:hypothetical protein